MAQWIKNIRTWLKSPHPFGLNWMNVLLPSGVVGLILFAVAPFGFQYLKVLPRMGYALIFALVTALVVAFVVSIIERMQIFKADEWTLGTDLLFSGFLLTIIAISNIFLIKVLGLTERSLWDLIPVGITRTLALGWIPVGILTLVEQYQWKQQQILQLQTLNTQLQEKNKKQDQPKQLVLENEMGKPEIQLWPQQLIYLQSDRNYIEVYFDEDGIKKHILRNRLKNLLPKLPEDHFFHCHKSYVVNLNKIQKVEGNSRKMMLKLQSGATAIPVSRSKVAELASLLKND